MTFIRYKNKFGYWRLGRQIDNDKYIVYNYRGGHHYISKEELQNTDQVECDDWYQLYLITKYCPLKVDIYCCDVWISPEGEFYDGKAHSVTAEDICEILFGKEIEHPDDYLEEIGYIKATTSLMWEVRFESFENKNLTQKQYDALFDWCQLHKKAFPNVGVEF